MIARGGPSAPVLIVALLAAGIAAPAPAPASARVSGQSQDAAHEARHVVREGETLGGVANRAGVDKAVIVAANGLVEPYLLETGQVLAIPRQRSHVVQPGETALGLARRYGVPFETLTVANELRAPYAIRVGQRLIVPAVLAAPPPMPSRAAAREPYFRRPHDGAVLRGFSAEHDGIDIAAHEGDMVRAAASGTVSFADTEPTRFGRQVLIDHGNGWQTSYGHLSRLTVKKGDVVKTGERIGLAGDAGTATRPELHFEIRHDGRDVDPAGKLPPRPE